MHSQDDINMTVFLSVHYDTVDYIDMTNHYKTTSQITQHRVEK